MYTINELAKLSGLSTRALRHYDQIGLLSPTRSDSNGYRLYSDADIGTLQQIMFYRELSMSLLIIKEIINGADFESGAALLEHREKLMDRKKQIELLLKNIDKTIKGEIMDNKEKFEGFKENLIKQNEEKYGAEIRAKYGDDEIDKSNAKLKNMTKEEYENIEALTNEVTETLAAAFKTGDPTSPLAQKAAELHKKWLCFYWDKYSPEAHAGLAKMYVEDERFKAYYDKDVPGTAQFLRDAVLYYIEKK